MDRAIHDRSVIIPHRSIRLAPVSASRIFMAILLAALSSGLVAASAIVLLRIHESACAALLGLMQVAGAGWDHLQVLDFFGEIAIPAVSVPSLSAEPWRVTVICAPVFALLLIAHRKYPLSRSLVFFIIGLILFALAAMVFQPALTISSTEFTRLWLRTQIVVWFLLPWLGALLILPLEASCLYGAVWIAFILIYGIAWSAVRLAFCLGVMHYTGILFSTAMWFLLGPLADLLYILACYSFLVRYTATRRWGGRKCGS